MEGDSELEPAQIPGGGLKPEVERDRLSAIVQSFNDRFGKPLTPSQEQFIGDELPKTLHSDTGYQAAKANSDMQNAFDVYAKNFQAEMQKRMFSETDLFKKMSQDKDLATFLIRALFEADYHSSVEGC